MIRSNQLILKADLFNKLWEFGVSSVQLNKHKNSKLKNPALCRVYVYHNYSVTGLLNQLELMVDSDLIPKKLNQVIKPVLSSHTNGFIRLTLIKNLLPFEKELDIIFHISQRIRDLIKELE